MFCFGVLVLFFFFFWGGGGCFFLFQSLFVPFYPSSSSSSQADIFLGKLPDSLVSFFWLCDQFMRPTIIPTPTSLPSSHKISKRKNCIKNTSLCGRYGGKMIAAVLRIGVGGWAVQVDVGYSPIHLFPSNATSDWFLPR